MGKQNPMSRKAFIRLLAGSGLGFLAWIWYRLSYSESRQSGAYEYRHTDIPAGVSFHGKYYLYRKDDLVLAFSATCTHAGCRLLGTNTEIIHCGCHGSTFDAGTGKPLKGPAIQPLDKIECTYNDKSGEWIVKYKSPANPSV